eukprot:SAG31_NODE_33348_length_344_cov_3.130612_1_plen_101_part_01
MFDFYNDGNLNNGFLFHDGGDGRSNFEHAWHPVCIKEHRPSCEIGAVDAEACWDSDCKPNAAGATFVLYRLPMGVFANSASGAQQYQRVCEAAGLHPLCSG